MISGSDPLIRLGTRDTVAVARFDIAAGQPLGDGSLRANQAIPRGHKVAMVDIAGGCGGPEVWTADRDRFIRNSRRRSCPFA